ncbi:MAG: DUF4192 domain-containing protein [Propionibacteriaceae bacterium]|nr:DUF4192 domain-containing protein [Propionibacteriaceae bacterium]
MTTIPVLRSNSRADLLAIPSYIFEFHPSESVVVIAMRENIVAFSARLEANWFETQFDQTANQLINASARLGSCHFLLLGYSKDLELAYIGVREAAEVLGMYRVSEALITNGSEYWSLPDGVGPVPYDPDTSPITAQAVYSGVNIAASREEAVAPVVEWDPPSEDVLCQALDDIQALLPDERLSLLQELIESDPPVGGEDALNLACLMMDEECAAAVLAALNMANAEVLWANLSAARRVTPIVAEPTVVSLLGLSSWLAGRGAQASACVEQMALLEPCHPIGGLLTRIHLGGIAPQEWECVIGEHG